MPSLVLVTAGSFVAHHSETCILLRPEDTGNRFVKFPAKVGVNKLLERVSHLQYRRAALTQGNVMAFIKLRRVGSMVPLNPLNQHTWKPRIVNFRAKCIT